MIKNQEAIKGALNDLIGSSTDPKIIAAQTKIVGMIDDAGKDADALEARTVELAKQLRSTIMGGPAPAQKPPEPPSGEPAQTKPKSFDECMKEIIAKRPKA